MNSAFHRYAHLCSVSRAFLFLSLVFSPALVRAADVTFSLPLQGHYRPGLYMPLRVTAQTDSANDQLTLRATGALTTEIESKEHKIDGVVPWLSIRAIHDVRWSTPAAEHAVDLPLHAMDDDDRLIGYAGADADALAPLFPGKKLIRVPLDVTDPLPGNILAWESLDGVVLDAEAAARMKEYAVRSLLAGGTAIAIRSTKKPDDGWAWQHHGAYWIIRADIAGPTSAYMPDAYAPAETWLRGWPMSIRKKLIVAVVVFVILATAVTLWRSRWAVALVAAMCALTTVLAYLWTAHQSPAIEAGGSIIVLTNFTTQRDQWTYRATLRQSAGSFGCPQSGLSLPVFASRQQPDLMGVTLHCDSTGTPTNITYRLAPGQSLAFQTRNIEPIRENVTTITPIISPLGALADRQYALKDDRLVGQVHDNADSRWPAVVVERVIEPTRH